jgi:uncharacterized protein (TIGR02466 family)
MALEMDLGFGMRLVFGTPILVRTLKDPGSLNTRLREVILKAKAEDSGRAVSNVGGWQSAPTLMGWPLPEIGIVKTMVEDAVVQLASLPFGRPVNLEYSSEGWANVNRNGDYNTAHNHAGEHWAMVYYVACGEPTAGRPMNGKLELNDPRPAATIAGGERYKGFTFGQGLVIDPAPGMLVAFPGWLQHFVHPFFGQGERISLAINVRIKTAQPLAHDTPV